MRRRLLSLAMGAALAFLGTVALATGPPAEKFARPAFVSPVMVGEELYTPAYSNRHETYVLRFELGPNRDVHLVVLDGRGGPSFQSLTVVPSDDLRIFATDYAGPFKVGWDLPPWG